MVVGERVSDQAFERIALGDPDRVWELQEGRLREKPAMRWDHNWAAVKLGHFLLSQLDWNEYQVRVNAGHLRRPTASYYVPDVCLVPVPMGDPFRGRSDTLEVFDAPLPLVVEVWSPSTGDYDVDAKVPEYMARGDLEIWRLHPYQRTLTAWRRQPDGSYEQTVATGGTVRPASLPGVAIDLDTLFED